MKKAPGRPSLRSSHFEHAAFDMSVGFPSGNA